MSTKNIPARERLIFALDVGDAEAARRLVDRLGDSVSFYKLGLELFMAGGYFELLEWLRGKGKQVFVDLKFFDVPQTVGSAVRQLAKHGASFATVHGNDAILEAYKANQGFPTTFVVDAGGMIVSKMIGAQPSKFESLQKAVDAALAQR